MKPATGAACITRWECHQTTLERLIRLSTAFRLRERYRAVIRLRAKQEVSGVLTPKSVVEAVQ